MPGRLTAYVCPIVEPIDDLQGHFTRVTTLHRDAHSHLLTQVKNLTTMSGSDTFQGSPAIAFSTFVQQHIDKSENHMQMLDQVTSTLSTCSNDIVTAGIHADTAGIDENILEALLGSLGHDEVIQDGGDAVQRVLQNLANDWERLKHDAHDLADNLMLIAGDAIHFTEDMVVLVGQTLVKIGTYVMEVLKQWGEAIKNAVNACLHAIDQFLIQLAKGTEQWVFSASKTLGQWAQQAHDSINPWLSFDIPLRDPHPRGIPEAAIPDLLKGDGLINHYHPAHGNKEPFFGFISAADIYKDMYQKKTDKGKEVPLPIGIRQIGDHQILVTIDGLNPLHIDYPTGAFTAADVGAGNQMNSYIQDVRDAINSYIYEHNLDPNTLHVTVAGHSLGGMVAEYLAEGNNNSTIQYKITHVITYGAGEVGTPIPGVTYDQFYYAGDPVPYLSKHELGKMATGQFGHDSQTLYVHQKGVPNNTSSPSYEFWIRHQAYPNSPNIQSANILPEATYIGQAEYYTGTKQNPWIARARLEQTVQNTVITQVAKFVFPNLAPTSAS